MATNQALRRFLTTKVYKVGLSRNSTSAGITLIGTDKSDPFQNALFLISNAVQALYDPATDSFSDTETVALPPGNFNAGVCGAWNPNGPTGTVSAVGTLASGSTTYSTATTNYTSNRSIAGWTLRITGGTGAGQEKVVAGNTIGANSVFRFADAWATPLDATSTWCLRSGRYYVMFSGTVGAGTFKYFDRASQTWTTLSNTNLPGSWGTDGSMAAPCCTIFVPSRLATGATGTTLADTTRAWTASRWIKSQVRITEGPGAGQVRTISANTPTGLTVPAWGINPTNASKYVIEANEDKIYLAGNGAITLYEYTISTDTWVVLTPGVARAGATAVGMSLNYIDRDPDVLWSDETSAKGNGSYLYSYRGGASGFLDIYDISANTWTTAVSPESFGNGSSHTYANGYIYSQRDVTNRYTRRRPSSATSEPCLMVGLTQGAAAAAGNRMFSTTFTADGVDRVNIYHQGSLTQHITSFEDF